MTMMTTDTPELVAIQEAKSELSKLLRSGAPPPVKPDRGILDEKIRSRLTDIKHKQARIDQITSEIESIKAGHAALKSSTEDPLKAMREELRNATAEVTELRQKRARVSSAIQDVKQKSKELRARIREQRNRMGPFTTMDSIDAEVERIEHVMRYSNTSVQTEKQFIKTLAQLDSMRSGVSTLEQLEAASATEDYHHEQAQLCAEEATIVSSMHAAQEVVKALKNRLREATASKARAAESERFMELLEHRSDLRSSMNVQRDEIRKLKEQHGADHAAWLAHRDRVSELKSIIRKTSRQVRAKTLPQSPTEGSESSTAGISKEEQEAAEKVVEYRQILQFLESQDAARTETTGGADSQPSSPCCSATCVLGDEKLRQPKKHKQAGRLKLPLQVVGALSAMSIAIPSRRSELSDAMDGVREIIRQYQPLAGESQQ